MSHDLDQAGPLYPGHHAATDPDKPAIVVDQTGETVTYGELDRFANQLSQLFRSNGLAVGDHVAILMENRAEFLPVVWGCVYAGLYYTAISTRLTATEAAYIVNDCGARILITSSDRGATAEQLIDLTPNVEHRLTVGGPVDGHRDLVDDLATFPSDPIEDRVEGADMLYSSGTTGQPKGVLTPLSGEPIGSPPLLGPLLGVFGLDADCRYLSPAPLYHGAPLRFCVTVHKVGGTVIVMPKFDAEASLAAIESHRVTTSQWVPTMFVRMLKLDPATRSKYDVSSLQVAVHAAAPISVEAKLQMIEWWGPVLHEYYGGTEGNGVTYVSSEEWLTHQGTVGRAVVGEVHIVDDDGVELPAGEVGTVYFGNGATFEYHNDPAKTAASRSTHGWSTMGDIGRVDADGYLYLTDRKANMIISGGVNIYPQEAENALTMHPDVIDVAVFGIPNEDFGEEVKAVVQPTTMPDGPEDEARFEAELIRYCREKLADYKCPRTIDFRPDLPRHPTGKLYKRLLQDEYKASRASASDGNGSPP